MGRDTSAYMPHEQNGLPEFPIPLALPHNIAAAAVAHSTEFWPQNFPLHTSFNPALLHQNLLPAYKMPNIHAFLTQYMGLNNLGILNYPHGLSVGPRISPTIINSGGSSKESPSSHDVDKWAMMHANGGFRNLTAAILISGQRFVYKHEQINRHYGDAYKKLEWKMWLLENNVPLCIVYSLFV